MSRQIEALKAAREALEHYLHGGSTYRRPAVAAVVLIDAALSEEAQPEPVAHMWQHPETGLTGFVEHAPLNELAHWEHMNRPRKIVRPLYAQPVPALPEGWVAMPRDSDQQLMKFYTASTRSMR